MLRAPRQLLQSAVRAVETMTASGIDVILELPCTARNADESKEESRFLREWTPASPARYPAGIGILQSPSMRMALEDVVVLDLSHALAGPFASTMLADYGATVIKIEPPEGEMARAWGPPFYEGETAYFVNLN